jgi:protein-disulfide isomerase
MAEGAKHSEGHPHTQHEHVHHESHKKPRNYTPAYMVVIAAVFLVIGFVAAGAAGGAGAAVTKDVAAAKAVDYINTNLMSSGQTVSLTSVNESSGMYLIVVNVAGKDIGEVYVSKDGQNIILGPVLNMGKPLPGAGTGTNTNANTNTNTNTQSTAPKTDKPSVELYVMSFCPYGVQAETAMAPVVDLLKDKADIRIRFIASIGSTIDSVQSLHGAVEGKEDIRQLCVMKNYGTTTYWKYLAEINSKCYPIYRNGEDGYNTCWKAAAATAGIDTTKIDSCMASEGVALLKAEETADNTNGVSGSPTLIINGVKYNGARTPEAFKTAICNAFTTAPAECSQTLSGASATATAAGGCG